MPKRSSKTKRDVNQLAADILKAATGEPDELTSKGTKNPAAVALGRMGGLKGGKARAKNLTAEQLAEIGKKGAAARWKDKATARRETSSAARSSRQKPQKKKRRAVIQVQDD